MDNNGTELFIEKVKSIPMLYDTKHPQFRNTTKKNKRWRAISAEFSMEDIYDSRKKWKNLRDTYTKYLRGVKSPGKQYYAHWQWAPQMRFMQSFVKVKEIINKSTYREAIESLNSEASPDSVDSSSSSDDENLLAPKSSDMIEDEVMAKDPLLNSLTKLEAPTETFVIKTENNYEYIIKENNCENQVTENNCKKQVTEKDCENQVKENSCENQVPETMDELELIFLEHAKSVKKLSVVRQTIVKMRLAQIIAEQELLQCAGMSLS